VNKCRALNLENAGLIKQLAEEEQTRLMTEALLASTQSDLTAAKVCLAGA
jgi:hypothetical protein